MDIDISIDEPNIELTADTPDIIVETVQEVSYTLPPATASTLGGVIIGDNIEVTEQGEISVPLASTSDFGVVKAGANITITDGVISTTPSAYILPQATTVTLGGVYVDNALSSYSQNPVQNKVVKSNIDSLANNITSITDTLTLYGTDISNLSTSLSNLTSSVQGNTTSITNLQSTVGAHTEAISNNSAAIIENSGDIDTLDGRLDTAEENITDITNGVDALEDNITALMNVTDVTLNYDELDTTAWTAGSVTVYGRGLISNINFILTTAGVTIPANDEYVIHNFTDITIAKDAIGFVDCDGTFISAGLKTNGDLVLVNNSSVSLTATKVYGSITAFAYVTV